MNEHIMKMVRWMCVKRLRDKVPPVKLGDRLSIESIRLVLRRHRLRWFDD